jgi:hypothetical protein
MLAENKGISMVNEKIKRLQTRKLQEHTVAYQWKEKSDGK